MRTAFVEAITRLAEKDERIWLLCGDLGFSVLEVFAERFPKRFLNVGVAEQNMTGVAAGLALSGKVVFTYSIGNFPIMRCLEQIRNDVCYHNLNVNIVSVGGGLAYGSLGYTHHSVEDLGVMRVLPNVAVLAPADPVETAMATEAAVAWNGPCYLHIGKAGEEVVHQSPPDFHIGKAIRMRQGSDITLVSTGGMLACAISAADELATRGLSATVLSMPTIRPLDDNAIVDAARSTGRIMSIEEHGAGALAAAVSEALAVSDCRACFTPLLLDSKPITLAGSQQSLRSAQGLCPEGIVATAIDLLGKEST